MKYFATLFVAASLLVACAGAREGDNTEVSDSLAQVTEVTGEVYQIKSDSSNIAWTGSKPTGQHNGTVNFSSGELIVAEGQLVGGSFVADMNTIEVLDLEKGSEYHGKLVGHLKSGDFFSVDSFPTATFVITSVNAKMAGAPVGDITPTHTITGNLTVKGISKTISLDAQVSINANTVSAKTVNAILDRTEWNVKYQSKKFFADLQDKFIHDEFGLAITLQASK